MIIHCLQCGKDKERYVWQKIPSNQKSFCSKICHGKYLSEKAKERRESPPLEKKGKSYEEYVMEGYNLSKRKARERIALSKSLV